MRKVVVTRLVPYKKSVIWNYLADIRSYPRHVTFVKKVELIGELKNGSEWYDTTGILWIPVRLHHKNTHWEEQNKIAFKVKMPNGGDMMHEYSLESIGDKTKLTCIIYFDFNNKIVDAILGQLLSRRLVYMLESTLERIDKRLQAN